MKKPFLLFLPLLLAGAAHAQIYADFTTSMGDFTCELNPTASPKAVANFIGLAEGSRPWIDPVNNGVRTTPFYDGLTFHRVIKDFMNQSGSRDGQGSDNPGYQFRDEFNNGLAHNAFVLSMANSGPNTNGAQFFVTAAAAPWLDGVHTVFGAVTTGQSVVTAINTVPTASSRPLTPVILHSVKIRRVGAAAQAFDINAQGLPSITGRKGTLNVVPGTKSEFLQSSARVGGSILHIFRSENLQTWTRGNTPVFLGKGGTAPTTLTLDTAAAPKAFYQICEVSYPDALMPESSASRVAALSWTEGGTNYSMVFTFAASGTSGTAVYSGDGISRTFTLVDYSKTAWAATWTMNVSGIGGMAFDFDLTGETGAAYTGPHGFYQYLSTGWVTIGTGTMTFSK